MGVHPDRREEKHTVSLGRTDKALYPNCTGQIEITFRRGKTDVAPSLDIDLKPISEYTEVLIGFNVRNRRDVLLWTHDAEEITRLFPDKKEIVERFGELAHRARHTGTQAGTRAQLEYLDRHHTELKNIEFPDQDHYDRCRQILKRANLYYDGTWRGSTGDQTPRPYQYGEAWLCASVPPELEADILKAIKDAGGQ